MTVLSLARTQAAAVAVSALSVASAHAQADRPLTLAYQVTHTVNIDPSFSPDGKRMVFISAIARKEQLFTANLDGTGLVQLTRDEADHEDPAWSPAGDKIAFVLVKDGLEQIQLMNADGSGVEPLTPREMRTIHPNWSPDGRRVVFCTDDDLEPPRKNDADIKAIDLATRLIETLVTGGVNTYPAWSPDGKLLAFRRMVDGTNSEVFVAAADGTHPKNLTNSPAFDGWPAWSPDSKRIAFASNRNLSYEIYVMNPDGTDVRKVAGNEGRATAPQWAKDGRAIYFPICRKVDFRFDCEIFAAKLDAFGG